MSDVLQFGSLDLTDHSRWVVIGHDPGVPNSRLNFRQRLLTIVVKGATPDDVRANNAALRAEFRKAEQYARRSRITSVTLKVQPGSSNPAYFHVMGDPTGLVGGLTITPAAWSTINLSYEATATLLINTTSYGRMDRQVATNALVNSADLTDSSVWTLTNATLPNTDITAPDGSSTAFDLRETTATGVHGLYQSIVKSASALDYVLSAYIAPNTRTQGSLVVDDGTAANGVIATFDASGGSVVVQGSAFGSGWTAGTASIVADNEGYYRCILPVTTSAGTVARGHVRTYNAGTSFAGGTTQGLYVWGPSLQQASSVGPYLETGASLTITNGSASTAYLYGLDGDVAGLVRLTLSDVGSNVINDWIIGQMASDDLMSADFQPWLAVTPESGASVSDSDTVSANIAQLTASTSAQQLGTFSKPSTARYNEGTRKIIGRVRDHSTIAVQPTGLAGIAGNLVTSNATSTTVGTGNNTVTLSITTPASGHLMVLGVKANFSTSQSINTPSGWSVLVNPSPFSAAHSALFYKISNGTETSVTVTTTANVSGSLDVTYVEVAGNAASPADASGSIASSATPATVSTTGSTAQANEIVIVMAHGTLTATLAASGFSSLAQANSASAAGRYALFAKVVTATGTQSATITQTSGSIDAAIGTFKGFTAAAPDLAADTYTCAVAGVTAGGVVGQASSTVPVTVVANGAIALTWTAGGGASYYRVYFKTSAGSYMYFDTPDSSTSYTITTATGATTGDPSATAASVTVGQYRLKIALASGTLWQVGPWVSTVVANGNWEDLDFKVVPGTGQPALLDGSPVGWKYAVECKHQSATPLMDIDVLIELPTKHPSVHLYYQDPSTGDLLGLATNRDWRYDVLPDLSSSRVLFATGTSTDAGQFYRDGLLLIEPPRAKLVIVTLIAGGISDVTNAQYTLGVEYTPLVEWFA